jgi:hypothetical protein
VVGAAGVTVLWGVLVTPAGAVSPEVVPAEVVVGALEPDAVTSDDVVSDEVVLDEVVSVELVGAEDVSAAVGVRPTPVLTDVPCGAAGAPIVGSAARKSVALGAWMSLTARCVLS